MFSESTEKEIRDCFNPIIIKRAKEVFQKLNESGLNYKISITGNIGSGKSLICDCLTLLAIDNGIDTAAIPEFLYADGLIDSELELKDTNNRIVKTRESKLLQDRQEGRISVKTFQSAILDKFSILLERTDIKSVQFAIIERTPLDVVILFDNIANLQNTITTIQMHEHYLTALEITNTHKLPSYVSSETSFRKILSSTISINLLEVLDEIMQDLIDEIELKIIGLSVPVSESKCRIIKRNRPGEICDEKMLTILHSMYETLYSRLEKGIYICRFLEIGSLKLE